MFKKLLKKYEDWRMSKYYLSIWDCPMDNWKKLYEKKDFRQLSKTGKLCKRIEKVYELLQDQLIDEFGINKDMLKIIKNKIRIELLYAEQIRTGDRSTKWKIDFLELDNAELSKKQTKTDFYMQTFELQKHLPYRIDLKIISVGEYYKDMEMVSKSIKPK